MALPSSGTISASMINIESAAVSSSNAPLSGDSSTPQNGSLVKRFDDATPTPVDQNAPHAYSEFYGKTFTAPFIACGGVLDAGNGNGYFEATVTSGNPTGAIIVYFDPQSVPDGIAYVFDSTTYNNLTSNTFGFQAGIGTNLNIVGNSSNDCSISANSPYTLNTSIWNGTSFGLNGGTTSVNTTNVNLNTQGGITYTLVIPKPNSTPTTGTLKIVGPCSGTGWDVKVLCPSTLPSFTTNNTESTFQGACCATQDKTFYFVRNCTSNFTVDTNTVPQVGNFVFADDKGENSLLNGYYKITSNSALYVQNGVVSSISTGCSSCVTSFNSSLSSTSSNVCSATINQTYYHDGTGSTPIAGDNVYSNSAGTTALTSGYYHIGSSRYLIVSAGGNVTSVNICVTQFPGSSGSSSNKFICSASVNTNYWHDGSSSYPQVGDTVYTNSTGTTTTSSKYIKLGLSYLTLANLDGVVTAITIC
jgi:hypothetical protein